MDKELIDELTHLSGMISGASWLLTSVVAVLDTETKTRLADHWATQKAGVMTDLLLSSHRDGSDLKVFQDAFQRTVRQAEALLVRSPDT